MRWPDLFFKTRKPKPVPEIATVPAKPAEFADPSKAGAPAKTETLKVGAAMSERDKTDSLRALSETDNDRPLSFDKASPAAEPAATQPVNGTPAPADASNVKTTALPAVQRPQTLSLRQRAKLTEDALSLPRKEDVPAPVKAKEAPVAKPDGEPQPDKASEPAAPSEAAPAAVVPPAFTVPVETGSVMESSPEKPAATPAPGAEASRTAAADLSENVDGPPTAKFETAPPSSDTARVHLAHTTTRETPSTEIEPAKPVADSREKQEFVLANGERILGHVLSETPQTIYLDHGTLGVLTLPRSQVANKPIEVILINGDRIVGDLIAETSECLYIKHASLGMLTVPHGQRSTRVVEAILKDGDRILGEVLAETDNFTVIRSATLGTVAVQHEQVAMLNRKIEQMQLRTLPAAAAAAALPDKKD